MIVEIKKTNKKLGLRAGHWYKAQKDWIDPIRKISLLRRVTKDGRLREFKREPNCNTLLSNVKIIGASH